MVNPLILYSTNTWLAYMIAEQYYGGIHYVWCSRHFNDKTVPAYENTLTPSSTPGDIYLELFEAVKRNDQHSAKIEKNKIGILKGAEYKRKEKSITRTQLKAIAAIVHRADISYFRPYLYLIPYDNVKARVKEVSVRDRAHLLGAEFLIERLPRSCFDVVQFDWR